ncbi:MAG: ADP-ribosylation factor-like protein [Candidatus Hodarchaeales archaeon]|jgi:GTPase SAR1 family protein
MFEYSNTNVMLGYDPGLVSSEDPQFQFLTIKEPNKGFDAVKVIIALDYEYPKRSYSVLAKQICDILKNLRDRFPSSEAKNLITNEFLTNQIENLILQCATLIHLRFSKEFKLGYIKWNDKILTYLSMGQFVKDYTPTLGMNRYTLPGVLGADWEPVFLEVSGREDFRPLWLEYDDLVGIIYVIDSNDHERLNESLQELKNLLQKTHFMNLPFAIIANKQDLPTSAEISLLTSEINKIASSSFRISVFPTSGITGEGLTASLHWLLDYIWFLAQNTEM